MLASFVDGCKGQLAAALPGGPILTGLSWLTPLVLPCRLAQRLRHLGWRRRPGERYRITHTRGGGDLVTVSRLVSCRCSTCSTLRRPVRLSAQTHMTARVHNWYWLWMVGLVGQGSSAIIGSWMQDLEEQPTLGSAANAWSSGVLYIRLGPVEPAANLTELLEFMHVELATLCGFADPAHIQVVCRLLHLQCIGGVYGLARSLPVGWHCQVDLNLTAAVPMLKVEAPPDAANRSCWHACSRSGARVCAPCSAALPGCFLDLHGLPDFAWGP